MDRVLGVLAVVGVFGLVTRTLTALIADDLTSQDRRAALRQRMDEASARGVRPS